MRNTRRGGRAFDGLLVGLPLPAGLAALLVLHFAEPPLAVTWSFAHLHRRPVLPWIAAALVVALPAAASWWWRRPEVQAPLGTLRARTILLAGALVFPALAGAGLRWPAPFVSLDPVYFKIWVTEGTWHNARWHLTLWLFERLAALLHRVAGALSVIRVVNALVVTVALLAFVGAARRLGRTRGEAAAMVLLVATAFGVFQLGLGFVDVYPMALAFLALYLWTALGVLDGALHPAWPALLLAIGPFFYEGLLLLAPSALVWSVEVLRRRDGRSRIAAAGAAALAAAGAATLPYYGRPLAWWAFLDDLQRSNVTELGLSPTSILLPPRYLVGATHAQELLHTAMLLDPVGWLLLLIAGGWLLLRARGRPWNPKVALLAAVVLPATVYFLTMDPLWGAFADWDPFGYLVAPTALLGAYAFVVWGRERPRVFALLLGLALATASVHLLARADALDVDMDRHLKESPWHMIPPPDAP